MTTATGGRFDGACPDPRTTVVPCRQVHGVIFTLGYRCPMRRNASASSTAVFTTASPAAAPAPCQPPPAVSAMAADWRLSGKPGRGFDHGLCWIITATGFRSGVGFQAPQPLGFSDGTAARKGSSKAGGLVERRADHFRFGGVQHLRVVGVFHLTAFQNGKQPWTLGVLSWGKGSGGRGRPQGWTISQSVRRRQRTPCPPQVQVDGCPRMDFSRARFRIDHQWNQSAFRH